MEQTVDLRYPIGRFQAPAAYTSSIISQYIQQISDLPALLRGCVEDMTEEQLDMPYRPEGWTVRQLVHHIADSHINAYVRFKLALTEENPIIKPYEEKRWADLQDTFDVPVAVSLNLVEALHLRWVSLLKSLKDSDLERNYNHPEAGLVPLKRAVGLYAWHSNHHLAHITSLRQREGW